MVRSILVGRYKSTYVRWMENATEESGVRTADPGPQTRGNDTGKEKGEEKGGQGKSKGGVNRGARQKSVKNPMSGRENAGHQSDMHDGAELYV